MMKNNKNIMKKNNKKTPEQKHIFRKCVGCGEIKERSNLIRIVKTHDARELIIMPDSKHFGRSSYLCYNKDCLKNAIKKKRLQKTLKNEVSISILNCLENIIK